MTSTPCPKPAPTDCPRNAALLLAAVLAVALAAVLLLAQPVLASADRPAQPAPTPAPSTTLAQPAVTTSPIVGILILAAPLVFLIWKSRGKKAPNITATCCLPVIDESKRPFMPSDDSTPTQNP